MASIEQVRQIFASFAVRVECWKTLENTADHRSNMVVHFRNKEGFEGFIDMEFRPGLEIIVKKVSLYASSEVFFNLSRELIQLQIEVEELQAEDVISGGEW